MTSAYSGGSRHARLDDEIDPSRTAASSAIITSIGSVYFVGFNEQRVPDGRAVILHCSAAKKISAILPYPKRPPAELTYFSLRTSCHLPDPNAVQRIAAIIPCRSDSGPTLCNTRHLRLAPAVYPWIDLTPISAAAGSLILEMGLITIAESPPGSGQITSAYSARLRQITGPHLWRLYREQSYSLENHGRDSVAGAARAACPWRSPGP